MSSSRQSAVSDTPRGLAADRALVFAEAIAAQDSVQAASLLAEDAVVEVVTAARRFGAGTESASAIAALLGEDPPGARVTIRSLVVDGDCAACEIWLAGGGHQQAALLMIRLADDGRIGEALIYQGPLLALAGEAA